MSLALAAKPVLVCRPEVTVGVTRGVVRLLVQLGYGPLLEASLPNGRRADVMGLGPRGDLVIVEVKSSIEDLRADLKWRDYLPYCDAFYFAVAPEFPQHALPDGPGRMVADGFGGALILDAPCTPLAAARRKALTLAFARQAALRGVAAATATG